MNVSIQANPTPYVMSNNSDIDATISIASDTIYNVLLRKVVSSEHDFRQHYLFIGNSEGNLTIEIEIEMRKNNYGNYASLSINFIISFISTNYLNDHITFRKIIPDYTVFNEIKFTHINDATFVKIF